MASDIDTPAKRARLAPRKNPYWLSIAGGRGGVSLGYRRPARGVGVWIVKTVLHGRRAEERIDDADDSVGAPGIDFKAAVSKALAWSERQHVVFSAEATEPSSKPTVRTAVEAYSKKREKLSSLNGGNARDRLAKHVLSDPLAEVRLAKLTSEDLTKWRARLVDLAPATVNRLLNDLRAALNETGVSRRRELPAHFAQEVRIGTKKEEAADLARRQILTDSQILSLVGAAYEVAREATDSEDFGHLVTLLAASGARYSQAARVRVGGFQHNQQRVIMPGSRKGRSRSERPPVAIQLAPDVCKRLLPAAQGRPADEPLLMRWWHIKKGRCDWQRAGRRPWGPQFEANRFWPDTVKRAGVPDDTVMYAFRHSSIVRGLRANLPVRLVAALHDTSVEMIEKHYSAYIVDATEELARRATLSLSPQSV